MTEWYYAIEGEQHGPVDASILRELYAEGTLDETSLVWEARLPQWVSIATTDLLTVGGVSEPDSIETPRADFQCVECRSYFADEEVIDFQGHWVCGACKPAFFQRVHESGRTTAGGIGSGGSATVAELLGETWVALRGRWWFSIGISFLASLVMLAGMVVPFIGIFAYLVLAGPMTVGLCRCFSMIALEDDRPSVNVLFSGFDSFGRNSGSFLLMMLMIYGWTLLLIIPGIVKGLAYALTPFILGEDEDVGAVEAIGQSRELMHGHKWRLFLLMMACSLLMWAALILVALLIGLVKIGTGGDGLILIGFTVGFAYIFISLVVPPFSLAVLARFYEDLKDG